MSKTDLITVNPVKVSNLYRQEIFHDPEAGSILCNTPVDATGQYDPIRRQIFHGSCTVMFGGRPSPIQFPIEASSLEEAITNYPEACRQAVQNILDQSVRNQLLKDIPSANAGKIDLSKLKN